MSSGLQARPQGWLQYINATDQNLSGGAGGTLAIALDTNAESSPSSFFDKPTTSQFRVLRTCTVRVSYGVTFDSNTNNEGVESFVRLNGSTKITQSRSGGNARTSNNEPTQASRTFLVNLNANDYLELCMEKLEGNTITATTRGTMMLVELVRLRN